MKSIVIIFLLLLVSLATTPALAFTEPSQSSDNATDVIIWHGDNLTVDNITIEDFTGTITIADLQSALDAAADSGASTLGDDIQSVSDDWLSLILVAFLIVIVFWRNHPIIDGIGTAICVVYGFTSAGNESLFSALWVAYLGMGLIGLYFLFRIATRVVGKNAD